MMASSNPQNANGKSIAAEVPPPPPPRKPRILLAACGSVSAVKFGVLCHSFVSWAEVRAVATKTSLYFIDRQSFPANVALFCDEHEWYNWRRIGDLVIHIELCKWADIMVIAPLSANTLAKIAGGVCDNLLTNIVRAWDYSSKRLFVAPSMNRLTWKNPLTEQHCMSIDELGISLIPPVMHRSNSGEEDCSMVEPEIICSTVRAYYDVKFLKKEVRYAVQCSLKL